MVFTSTAALTLTFATAPAAGAYRVVVFGGVGSGGAGGGITRNVSTVTTSATLAATAATDYVVFIGSGGAPVLPTAVGNTNLYTIKNVDIAARTVATTGGQTIDGSTSATLTPNTALSLVSDGTNWRIL